MLSRRGVGAAVAAFGPAFILTGCPRGGKTAASPTSDVTNTAPAPPPRTAPGTGARASASPASLTLDLSPSPPRQLAPTTFTVTSHPSFGRGASVAISLEMPSMAMPATDIQLHPTRAGKYEGSGAFPMSGTWRATIKTHDHGTVLTKTMTIPVN